MSDWNANDRNATDRARPESHLTDEALVIWLDEGREVNREAEASAHLAACESCRLRLADLERVFAALRAESPLPYEAALAAQRDRVRAAVEARPRSAAAQQSTGARPVKGRSAEVHPIRRWWWAPVAAAAVIIGLLLFAPERRVPPLPEGMSASRPSVEDPGASEQSLPVITEADRAAEEAYRSVLGAPATDEIRSEAPETAEIDAALASLQSGALSTPGLTGITLEEEFASLPAQDQAAILEELSRMTFEL